MPEDYKGESVLKHADWLHRNAFSKFRYCYDCLLAVVKRWCFRLRHGNRYWDHILVLVYSLHIVFSSFGVLLRHIRPQEDTQYRHFAADHSELLLPSKSSNDSVRDSQVL